MSSRRLDFLVFYRGNLVTGFDYVYLKRHEGHAFLQIADKTQPVKNITDPDFDFYNPHFNAAGEPFNWRYREDWLDMTAQWDDIAETQIRCNVADKVEQTIFANRNNKQHLLLLVDPLKTYIIKFVQLLLE